MNKKKIYNEIKKRSPLDIFSAPELLEELEKYPVKELLGDLDEVYETWGKLPKLYCTDEQKDIEQIQKCESLFDFITEAIFVQGDASVIPYLLKYVPSDDDDQDSVFMEDYSREQICNGITNTQHFGENYIPVLLGCIHELIPRAMSHADSFFRDMIYDNWGQFSGSAPLVQYLKFAEQKSFKMLIEYALKRMKEEIQEENEEKWILKLNITLERIYFIKKKILKLHEHDS